MGLSARQLNRATLDRQLLLRREPLGVVDVVRRVVALQAQEPASPYLALWNRLAGFDPAALDTAFAGHTLVRSNLIRLTLHVVRAADWPACYAAMVRSLRASRVGDRRFTSTGLTAADVDALLPQLAAFLTQPRTVAEIEELITDRLGEANPRAWWALRQYAPLHHAPTGGPWSFEAKAYLTAPAERGPESEDEAVSWLLLRYLQAYGPASARDFAQFTMLRQPVVARALTALGGKLERLTGPEARTLYDAAGEPLPDEDTPAPPRLLPMWESILLAYADRGRVVPEQYRAVVIRRNGDVLPTLLVDGHVAGVWRPVEDGIEATAFHRLDREAWQGLAAEAAALLAFLAVRDPDVYRRYTHWWTKPMPAAEVRILPG